MLLLLPSIMQLLLGGGELLIGKRQMPLLLAGRSGMACSGAAAPVGGGNAYTPHPPLLGCITPSRRLGLAIQHILAKPQVSLYLQQRSRQPAAARC
jgi:hypothetical protein